jgi:hypothetical protein
MKLTSSPTNSKDCSWEKVNKITKPVRKLTKKKSRKNKCI